MTVFSKIISISSDGENDMIDITDKISQVVTESKLDRGILIVFVSGSTSSITTIESEPGLKVDFPEMMSRLIPKDTIYKHNMTWHDGNGHSHLKSSLLGPDLMIPFVDRKLALGTWQQVVLLEFDTRPRHRKVVVQVMGE
jgi:secondary thiamine-phosphate synthase enzyme